MTSASRRGFVLGAFGALLAAPLPLRAATKSGVTFADTVVVAGKTLVLNGIGVRTATVFAVKVYVAALYVESKTSRAADVLRADRTKRLVAVFTRDIPRDQASKTFRDNVRRAAGADADAIKDDIERFARWMPKLRERQNLVVTFVPGEGTSVTATAASTPFTAGEIFGTALFRVWIGPTADADLRNGLLGLEG